MEDELVLNELELDSPAKITFTLRNRKHLPSMVYYDINKNINNEEKLSHITASGTRDSSSVGTASEKC